MYANHHLISKNCRHCNTNGKAAECFRTTNSQPKKCRKGVELGLRRFGALSTDHVFGLVELISGSMREDHVVPHPVGRIFGIFVATRMGRVFTAKSAVV